MFQFKLIESAFCTLLILCGLAITSLDSLARDADIGWGPTISTDANIYISTNGNDSNNGTIGAPVKSFNEARNLANSAETTSTNGVTVWMRGGWYTQSTTFTFNSTDGGSACKPIIWRAYPGNRL